MTWLVRLFVGVAVVGVLGVSGASASSSVFVVSSTADSGAGSLRQAILGANGHPGLDTIAFDIAGSAPFSIQPLSALPMVRDAVVIDATTQPGYAGSPIVRLDGSDVPTATGLDLAGGGSTVRGLDVTGFATGVRASTDPGDGDVFVGNYIGLDVDGVSPVGNGVGVSLHGSGNRVGGLTVGEGNVISGNTVAGVVVQPGRLWKVGAPCPNVVEGNLIGTDATGELAEGPFAGPGILVRCGGTRIGGTSPAARNLISGNYVGVRLAYGEGNVIEGNWIGLDATGTAIVGNSYGGVEVRTAKNQIGGTAAGAGNVISGNAVFGDPEVAVIVGKGNVIQGNYLGTNASGTANVYPGPIELSLLVQNQSLIGGSQPGAGNVIANGVVFNYDRGTVMQGNLIGTDASGTVAISQADIGINIFNGTDELIGGPTAADRNVIAGTVDVFPGNLVSGAGILLDIVEHSGDVIEGNYIGTNAAGSQALGNGGDGLLVEGGGASIQDNLISGNGRNGVDITGGGAPSDNIVQGNLVGTDATGTSAIPNGRAGINVACPFFCPVVNTTIGGTTPGSGNIVSGNTGPGIRIADSRTTGTLVQGNRIGTDPSATIPIANGGDGILLENQTFSNTIGGQGSAGNIVSDNAGSGIELITAGNNLVQQNTISANAGAGVIVNAATGDAILTNSIFGNALGGISLTAGGNNDQPAPTISTISASNGKTTISGSDPGSGPQRIEVFANPSCANAQGRTFLGATTTSTNLWTLTIPALPHGRGITATQTAANNTSQFSACTTS